MILITGPQHSPQQKRFSSRVRCGAPQLIQWITRGMSMENVTPRAEESRFDVLGRIEFHSPSRWEFLRDIVLRWFQKCGVRPVLLEIRSCCHRIQRREKNELLFDEVRLTLPKIDASDSRIETQ